MIEIRIENLIRVNVLLCSIRIDKNTNNHHCVCPNKKTSAQTLDANIHI
ncbi:MAG: hypothetical protein IKA08_01310 [Alphaproteobacteria bacterium]|nr:hypothetical protein [Alphaproteobacteria bacterium]